MKLKILAFAFALVVAVLFSRQCQAQYSNTCGAASFYLYGNYQNQEVLLHSIGINGNSYNGNPSLYFYSALTSTNAPIGTVVAQMVAINGVFQDGPSSFLLPNSPELQQLLQNVLLWGYNSYNTVNLGLHKPISTRLNRVAVDR